MVQQDTATVEQPTVSSGDQLDIDILKAAGIEPDVTEEPAIEADEELSEDDLEAEDAEGEEAGEDGDAEEPIEAIAPPVSLKKEQQAAFKQLAETNPELAKVWAESEAQRNEQVRIKTTEAAEATRNATFKAQADVAAVARQYAAELEVYAEAFQPTEPDLALLAENPQAYLQQKALYDQMTVQHHQLMQRIQGARGHADQIDQSFMAEQVQSEQARLRTEWPDILDPAKQADLWNTIVETGKAIGFDPSVLANANATEMLALRKVSEMKAKADKWDAFQASKMTKVRAAKALPRVSTPNTAPARSLSNQTKADAAWSRAKQTRSDSDMAAVYEAMGISLT